MVIANLASAARRVAPRAKTALRSASTVKGRADLLAGAG